MTQWRTVLKHNRRRPAGFTPPCLPISDANIPVGSEWIHELKWDGFRIIATRREGRLKLWSRNGIDWTPIFLRIAEAMARLPVKSVTIDGEAVYLREDGRPDFLALRSKRTCADATLIAFDLLEHDGRNLRGLPLDERRQALELLLRDGPGALRYSPHVKGSAGPDLFRQVCEAGLEGIISKRRDKPYRSGRYEWWRKITCPCYKHS